MIIVRLLLPEPCWLALSTTNCTRTEEPTLSWNQFHSKSPRQGVLSVNACLRQLITSIDFRFARQNEAAGAADATAWVMSAVQFSGSVNLWVTRRCSCDPFTQNDAGRTPASSLL